MMQQKHTLTSLTSPPTSLFQSRNRKAPQLSQYEQSQKETQKQHKTHLWKQLVSLPEQQNSQQCSTDALPQLSLQARSISQNSQYEQQSQDQYSLPIENLSQIMPKKQQFPRISSFLQNLHVHAIEDEQNSKFGTESQIISIMDIKYSELDQNSKISGFSPKLKSRMSERIPSNEHKSQYENKRLQILLLFRMIKEIHNQIKYEINKIIETMNKQQQNTYQAFEQLTNKLVSQITSKNIKIQQIQKQNRIIKQNNIKLTKELQKIQIKQQQMLQQIEHFQSINKIENNTTHSLQDNKIEQLVQTQFLNRNKAKTAQFPSHSQFLQNCSQSNSTNLSSKQLHGRRFQRTKRYHSPVNSHKNCILNHAASFNKIDNPPGHDNEERSKIINLADSLQSVYIQDKIIIRKRIGEKA